LGPYVEEHDESVFSHLKQVYYKLVDGFNFDVYLEFRENKYFTNKVLIKRFMMKDELEPIESTGTKIDWKQGQNVT